MRGLKDFLIINGSPHEKDMVLRRAVNVGLAVDTGEILFEPLKKGVAMKGIADLSREIGQITAKARKGKRYFAGIPRRG